MTPTHPKSVPMHLNDVVMMKSFSQYSHGQCLNQSNGQLDSPFVFPRRFLNLSKMFSILIFNELYLIDNDS